MCLSESILGHFLLNFCVPGASLYSTRLSITRLMRSHLSSSAASQPTSRSVLSSKVTLAVIFQVMADFHWLNSASIRPGTDYRPHFNTKVQWAYHILIHCQSCPTQLIRRLTRGIWPYDDIPWPASAKSQQVRATRATRVPRSSNSSHSRPGPGLFLNSSHPSILS